MKSWIDAAIAVLQVRGPMEIFALIDAAMKRKPVRKPSNQLGNQLFRLAKGNQHGLVVSEYPGFRLKSSTRPDGFPTAGRMAAAYKVLSLSRDYMDLRAITEKALASGVLKSVAGAPEYWMYEALMSNRAVLSQRGALKVSLDEARATEAASDKSSPSLLGKNIHEVHLEALIAEDLNCVEPGLELVGRQYHAPPVGRIDLLCRDTQGSLVVVEIKKFRASTESIIDQITRYLGWVRKHLARPRQNVRGIIIVGKADERLAYAVQAVPGLSIKCLNLSLRDYPVG